MPTQPTFPGVYIEEVPSGVRTITGVSTSITAFVGRTFKGPTDRATRMTNFGAFEKQFGGLWRDSTLSYAIRQFFQNGGTDTVVVRIVDGGGAASSITLNNGTPNGIQLLEAEAGSRGHTLRVQVTDDGSRHIVVTEIARSPSGAEVVVRTADYVGADAAALAAALAADDSLVRGLGRDRQFRRPASGRRTGGFSRGHGAGTSRSRTAGDRWRESRHHRAPLPEKRATTSPSRFCPARPTTTCILSWLSSGNPTAAIHCSAQPRP